MESGFLPAGDLKGFRKIVFLEDGDENYSKLLIFIKSKELRSLNLAANLHMHINMLETKQKSQEERTTKLARRS